MGFYPRGTVGGASCPEKYGGYAPAIAACPSLPVHRAVPPCCLPLQDLRIIAPKLEKLCLLDHYAFIKSKSKKRQGPAEGSLPPQCERVTVVGDVLFAVDFCLEELFGTEVQE